MPNATDNKKKVSRSGVIWNMLGSAMFGASSMLLFMFVSRATDLRTSGVYNIAFSTAQILYMVGIFGANHFQMTDYEQRYPFAAYRNVKLLSTLLMPAALLLAALVLGFDRERILLTGLLTLYMALCSAAELYQSMFFQKNRLDLSGRSVFLRTLLATAVFGAVIFTTGNLLFALFALITSALAGFLLFAVLPAGAFLSDAPKRAGKGDVKRLILECLPLFLSVVLMDIIIACPKYAVDAYLPEETTAVFGMIIMPVQILNLFCSFIFRPSLKSIADTIREKDAKRFSRILRNMILIVSALSLIASAAAYWPCPEVLTLFYGTDLTPYRWAFVFVLAGSGVFAMSHLLYYVLIILRKQRPLLINYGVCTVLAAASAYLLTGRYGIFGGIAAFVLTHIVLIVLHARSLRAALQPVFREETNHAVPSL